MLKILGRHTSSNVQKVLWCCDELGLDYDQTEIGGPFGGNREPDYLALNPNGRVPTIIDGDLVLWESNSIVRYLAATHDPGGLIPTEPGGRALVERWMDWELSTAVRPHATMMMQLIRTPPDKRDPEVIRTNLGLWSDAMKILDGQLAGNSFVAGERFSCADISLGTSSYRWFNLDIERPDLPHLAAWYGRLGERPAYRKHVMIEIV